MQSRAYALRSEEGESVWSLGGRFTVKLAGPQSEDRFSLVEAVAFIATEPPEHIHHAEDEAWYVLEGHMTFNVGGESFEAPPGTFVFGPRGVPHAFTVDVEPTRVLVFAAPAGFEQFALDLGHPAVDDSPPSDLAMSPPEILGPVAERYRIEVVGPPMRAKAAGDAH